MSVLVKGMEMPTCFSCQLESYCGRWAKHDEEWQKGNRDDDCPLIELPPHGRLIDADAMQMQWFNLNFDRKITDGTLAYWNFQLSKMPTIIEAEVEDG